MNRMALFAFWYGEGGASWRCVLDVKYLLLDVFVPFMCCLQLRLLKNVKNYRINIIVLILRNNDVCMGPSPIFGRYLRCVLRSEEVGVLLGSAIIYVRLL